MKHIKKGLENNNNNRMTEEASVLQRVLAMDNDTSTALFLALDLFLVGIDTVCKYSFHYFLNYINRSWESYAVSDSSWR